MVDTIAVTGNLQVNINNHITGTSGTKTTMYHKDVVISAENGLHVRPAAQLVKSSQSFACEITFAANGKSVSAKSLLKLQTLGLAKGTTVTISAAGEDEQRAVLTLVELLESLE